MSRFTDTMYRNAHTSTNGMVTGAQQQCGDVDINSCDEGAWTGRMGRRLRETGLQEHPLMAAAAA